MSKFIIGEKPVKYNLVYDDQKQSLSIKNGNQDVAVNNNNDCTAFQVYVTGQNIVAGSTQGTVHEQYIGVKQFANNVAGGTINKVYGNHEGFILRSNKTHQNNNVIVDWGDGTQTKLSQMTLGTSDMQPLTYYAYSSSQYRYIMVHTYDLPGVYQIQIIGDDYNGFIGKISNAKYKNINRICRIFQKDLPVASHILSVSSWCKQANLLTKINVAHSVFLKVENVARCFEKCANLKEVIGFKESINFTATNLGYLFSQCRALQQTDIYIPLHVSKLEYMFNECNSLDINFNVLCSLNSRSVNNDNTVNVDHMFWNCRAITALSQKAIWNNHNIQWVNAEQAINFEQYPQYIQSVPVSWGGEAIQTEYVKAKKNYQILHKTTSSLNIQPVQFLHNTYYEYDLKIDDIYLDIPSNIFNVYIKFTTSSDLSGGWDVVMTFDYKINKPFDFKPNKTYLMCIDNNVIVWGELK